MTVVSFATLAFSAVLAFLMLFIVAPRSLRSIYRARMWALRDDLWDAIDKRRFSEAEQPGRLLTEIELAIGYTPQLTAFTVLSFDFLLRNERDRLVLAPTRERVEIGEAPARDRELLASYVSDFHGLIRRQVFYASVSGWILGVLSFLAAAFCALRGRRREPEAIDGFAPSNGGVPPGREERPAVVVPLRQRDNERDLPDDDASPDCSRPSLWGGAREHAKEEVDVDAALAALAAAQERAVAAAENRELAVVGR